MAPSSASSYGTARPIFEVAGREQPPLSSGLLSLLIEESVHGLYRMEALLGNWGSVGGGTGFLYFDRSSLDFGKRIKVSFGNDLLFDGRITALEANFPDAMPPQLSVLAEDRLQDLRMTRRTRSFSSLSDADLMNRIAAEHGLSAKIDLQGPSHQVLAQVNLSDLAFLRERARAIDAEIWVEGDRLHAQMRAKRQSATLQLNYPGGLKEFSVLADLAGQRSSCTVSGWDVAGKSPLRYQAGEAAISGELGGNLSGASLLSTALGERKEAVVHAVPLGSDEAQAHAEAWFRSTARRFLTGRGRAQTDGRLKVGCQLDLQGLGPLFSGKYYLSSVRHLFDGVSGMRSEFSVERPWLGRP